jgi:hypothetical protein
MAGIKQNIEQYDDHFAPLLFGMAQVHDAGDDPCLCEGWDDPIKKYGKGVRINYEKGLLCSICSKKLNAKGLAWFRSSIGKEAP